MSRRARWIVVGVLVAAAATYALVGNPFDPFDNKRFAPHAWREGRARTQMCGDIIKRVVRPGMAEKEVVQLLGPPDRVHDRRIYEYVIDRWAFQSRTMPF
jgi:hypothetical protein